MGSNRVAVVLRNNTHDWIEIGKGMLVVRMVATNQVPRVVDTISAERSKEQPYEITVLQHGDSTF